MSSISQLEYEIAAIVQQAHIVRLDIALIDDQGLLYANVFGSNPTVREARLLTPLFQAASLSKPVFAYGVLNLWQQGKLDLDTPLSEIYADPLISDSQAKMITARHVLSHTTGLPNWREEVDQLTLIPETTPGTDFSYSGEAFEYLQRVVEHITGVPLHTHLATSVLDPLGMHQSRFAWGADIAGEALLDAVGIAAPHGERIIASAAWSLLTTASDYARFLVAMLHPHDTAPGYLNSTSITTMLTPQIVVGRRANVWWGLGWGLQRTSLGEAFWHWGGPQNGYTSYTATLMEQRKGIVILTNSETGLRVCEQIAQLALHVSQPAFQWILPEDQWQPTG